MNIGDRHVLMVVNGPGIPAQINTAPSRRRRSPRRSSLCCGLNPGQLTAVDKEGTQVLPRLTGPRWHR